MLLCEFEKPEIREKQPRIKLRLLFQCLSIIRLDYYYRLSLLNTAHKRLYDKDCYFKSCFLKIRSPIL